MDDQQVWNSGIERLNVLLAAFPADTVSAMANLLNRYRQAKEALAAVTASVEADSDCRECEGQCCQNGKYRINVFDTLACVVAQTQILTDYTQKPVCPYGSSVGCALESAMRPADCVLFICDAIDRKLTLQAREILAVEEQKVRQCINDASRLTGEPMGTPLLLWAVNKNKSNSMV